MDQQYWDIYERQLALYRTTQGVSEGPEDLAVARPPLWPDRRRDVARALAIVDSVVRDAGAAVVLESPLRPDGSLFLHLNLHQMVALPLALADRAINRDRVRQDLTVDCSKILEAAREHAEGGSLSAASILRGTGSVLDGLRLKSWRIWDRYHE